MRRAFAVVMVAGVVLAVAGLGSSAQAQDESRSLGDILTERLNIRPFRSAPQQAPAAQQPQMQPRGQAPAAQGVPSSAAPADAGASSRRRYNEPTPAAGGNADSRFAPRVTRPVEMTPPAPQVGTTVQSAQTGGGTLQDRLNSSRRSASVVEAVPTTPTPARVVAPHEQYEAVAANPRRTPAAAVVTPEMPAPSSPAAANTATSADDENVLITRQSPLLAVETSGPRKVLVGREATYQVLIRNAGRVAANDVLVTVSVPEGAEVVGYEPSTGNARDGQGNQPGGLLWNLTQLGAGDEEVLTLRIIPRRNRPFDLGVQWTFSSQTTQAVVEVQEPKLALNISGPEEVYYGRTAVYKLVITNPGTGDAENVIVRLLPTAPGADEIPTYEVGTVQPGDTKSVELELTARQSGTLGIRAEALGEAGLRAAVSEDILIRKPELATEIAGPPFVYAGTDVTYQVRVSNPGNATAKNVQVTALVPSGSEFVSASGSGDLIGDKISWNIPTIPAGSEQMLQFQCKINAEGVTKQQVTATADDELRSVHIASTEVEALADLVMEVTDPAGPILVGEEMTYVVTIRNRGTKGAEGVEIVAFFSQGIEPVSVAGGGHEISPGQVLFDKLRSLGPGRELVFKIQAVASDPGNHIVRAEAHCDSLGTTLAVEEATLFYSGRSLTAGGATSASGNPRYGQQQQPAPQQQPAQPQPTPAAGAGVPTPPPHQPQS